MVKWKKGEDIRAEVDAQTDMRREENERKKREAEAKAAADKKKK